MATNINTRCPPDAAPRTMLLLVPINKIHVSKRLMAQKNIFDFDLKKTNLKPIIFL